MLPRRGASTLRTWHSMPWMTAAAAAKERRRFAAVFRNSSDVSLNCQRPLRFAMRPVAWKQQEGRRRRMDPKMRQQQQRQLRPFLIRAPLVPSPQTTTTTTADSNAANAAKVEPRPCKYGGTDVRERFRWPRRKIGWRRADGAAVVLVQSMELTAAVLFVLWTASATTPCCYTF